MKKIKAVLSIFLLCFVTISAASAATITQELSKSTTISDTGTATDVLMQLAQFNPNLGTLTGAVLTLEGSYKSTFTATAYDNVPYANAVWIKLNNNISITSDLLNVENKDDFYGNYSPVKPGDTVTLSTDLLLPVTTKTYSNELAPFIGNGNIILQLNASSSDHDFSQNIKNTIITNKYSGTASVKYSYTPVPLPSAIIFLISGLVAVIGSRKLSSRQALS
jgi:hypothetical protein